MLLALSSHAQMRSAILMDLRRENASSPTLQPHLALAQHLVAQGYKGDVVVLVAEDFQAEGAWGAGLDLKSMSPDNPDGGRVVIRRPSDLVQEDSRMVESTAQFVNSPEEVSAPLIEAPEGLVLSPNLLTLRLSLMSEGERQKLEDYTGTPATERTFDGWLMTREGFAPLQSLARLISLDAPFKDSGIADFDDFLVQKEMPDLAAEILATVAFFSQGDFDKTTVYSQFMDFSHKLRLLQSRLQLRESCESNFALKKKTQHVYKKTP